jgi:hypothetical protein
MRRALAIIGAAVLLVIAGCSLSGPVAVPSEPFGDFVVTESGGIDGRQNIVYVRADGVALLVSRQPSSGRLSEETMSRLRDLLTSPQFRQEVVRDVQRKQRAPVPACSDQITTEVTMGSLAISRSDPCREKSEPTPTFDEIISIVAPALQGHFDGPVDAAEPLLSALWLRRIQLQDRPAYTMKVDNRGRAMIMMSGRSAERQSLSVQQRDTVRLLVARVIEKPVVPCTSQQASYQLHVENEPAVEGPDCGFPQRQPEFRALTALLENAFGV